MQCEILCSLNRPSSRGHDPRCACHLPAVDQLVTAHAHSLVSCSVHFAERKVKIDKVEAAAIQQQNIAASEQSQALRQKRTEAAVDSTARNVEEGIDQTADAAQEGIDQLSEGMQHCHYSTCRRHAIKVWVVGCLP